jgi:hypothetical protein
MADPENHPAFFRFSSLNHVKINKNNNRQMTKTWWEAPMGGSVLSFLKAE